MDFEVYSKGVADNVNSQQLNITKFDEIIKECKRLLTRYFMNFYVKFVRRQVNEIVHTLTKVSLSYANFHIFIDIPTCIHQFIINEMN